MPRNRDRFGDERDDYAEGPPRRQGNPALVLGLVLAGLLVGGLVCAGLGAMLFWTQAVDAPAPAANVAATPAGDEGVDEPAKPRDGTKRVYTGDEFKERVMGKTP